MYISSYKRFRKRICDCRLDFILDFFDNSFLLTYTKSLLTMVKNRSIFNQIKEHRRDVAVSFKRLWKAYSELLHLGRLYFCPYKKYLKRASASISKVRIAMTSIAFSYFVISARISLSLRLGDSHPIPRCSNKDNILWFKHNRQGIMR